VFVAGVIPSEVAVATESRNLAVVVAVALAVARSSRLPWCRVFFVGLKETRP